MKIDTKETIVINSSPSLPVRLIDNKYIIKLPTATPPKETGEDKIKHGRNISYIINTVVSPTLTSSRLKRNDDRLSHDEMATLCSELDKMALNLSKKHLDNHPQEEKEEQSEEGLKIDAGEKIVSGTGTRSATKHVGDSSKINNVSTLLGRIEMIINGKCVKRSSRLTTK